MAKISPRPLPGAGYHVLATLSGSTLHLWSAGTHRVLLASISRPHADVVSQGGWDQLAWCDQVPGLLCAATSQGWLHYYLVEPTSTPHGGGLFHHLHSSLPSPPYVVSPGHLEAVSIRPLQTVRGETSTGLVALVSVAGHLLAVTHDGLVLVYSWEQFHLRLRQPISALLAEVIDGPAMPTAACAAHQHLILALEGGLVAGIHLSRISPLLVEAPDSSLLPPPPTSAAASAASPWTSPQPSQPPTPRSDSDDGGSQSSSRHHQFSPLLFQVPMRPGQEPTCLDYDLTRRLLAVGLMSGDCDVFEVEIPLLGGDAAAHPPRLRRTLSGRGWDFTDLGGVTACQWAPRGGAVALGWHNRGVVVFSLGGCRLMSTLPLYASSSKVGEPLASGGGRSLCWDPTGYFLIAVAGGSSLPPGQFIQFSFLLSCNAVNIAKTSDTALALQGPDRVVLIARTGRRAGDVDLHHHTLPSAYLETNGPVRFVAVHPGGKAVAVAGQRGLAVLNLVTRKWSLFEDVSEEGRIHCHGLCWWGDLLLVCNLSTREVGTPHYQLLFLWAQRHLNLSRGLLHSEPMGTHKPLALDVTARTLLIYNANRLLSVFSLSREDPPPAGGPGVALPSPNSSPSSIPLLLAVSPSSQAFFYHAHQPPAIHVTLLKQISFSKVPHPPAVLRLLAPPDYHHQADEAGGTFSAGDAVGGPDADGDTTTGAADGFRCLVLRTDSTLTFLDLSRAQETPLAGRIEQMWVAPLPGGRGGSIPFWAYGEDGLRLWVTPAGDPPPDPVLQSDDEVMPLGFIPSQGVLLGIEQGHSLQAASARAFSFRLRLRSQPFVPALLHSLLRVGHEFQALQVARGFASLPVFDVGAEVLLYEALQDDLGHMGKNPEAKALQLDWEPALPRVVNLLRHFRRFPLHVVSAARKTDTVFWSYLFTTAGEPVKLFQQLLDLKEYDGAAATLRVLLHLQGAAAMCQHGLHLLELALQSGQWTLAAELVRSLHPSMYAEVTTTARQAAPPRQKPATQPGLPGSVRRTFSDRTIQPPSPPSPEKSLEQLDSEVTMAVQLLLTHYARGFLVRLQLPSLVAFASATMMNLSEFLRRERQRAARVEDFAKALDAVHKTYHIPQPQEDMQYAPDQLSPPRGSSKPLSRNVSGSVDPSAVVAILTSPLTKKSAIKTSRPGGVHRVASVLHGRSTSPPPRAGGGGGPTLVGGVPREVAAIAGGLGEVEWLLGVMRATKCVDWALVLATVLLRPSTVVAILQDEGGSSTLELYCQALEEHRAFAYRVTLLEFVRRSLRRE